MEARGLNRCSIEGCTVKYHAKGYCKHHYKQVFKPVYTPEYTAWINMKERCCNPNRTDYGNYGGRGVRLYSKWLHDFKAFHEYIGDRPSPNHSLDRIDNNRGYEPGNVRWATIHEQNANKRNSTKTPGVSFVKRYGSWESGIMVSGLRFRKVFKSHAEAIEYRLSLEKAYLTKSKGATS